MGILGPKSWVNPFGKMSIFSSFWTSWIYSQEKRFFVLEYHKKRFTGQYWLKKKVGKMRIFGPKPWVNPFGKCQFFDILNFLFLYPRKAFFVLEYHKRHFPGLYYLKKKVRKMAIFVLKPWVNPFGKMSIFRLFEVLVFIA